MNASCLFINNNVNFDSVTKSKWCGGQRVAVLHATLGLSDRDKKERGLEETEVQWTWAGGDSPQTETWKLLVKKM